jgi:hypothetical protein
MIRIQIYLTQQEQNALRAIDGYIEGYQRSRWVEMLRSACGIWSDRTDIDLRAIRAAFER